MEKVLIMIVLIMNGQSILNSNDSLELISKQAAQV